MTGGTTQGHQGGGSPTLISHHHLSLSPLDFWRCAFFVLHSSFIYYSYIKCVTNLSCSTSTRSRTHHACSSVRLLSNSPLDPPPLHHSPFSHHHPLPPPPPLLSPPNLQSIPTLVSLFALSSLVVSSILSLPLLRKDLILVVGDDGTFRVVM